MDRAMFGLKVPAREKEAMDFVSAQAEMPLSRIFYGVLHHAVEVSLGRVLIERADMGRPATGLPILPVDQNTAVPQLFVDFSTLADIHKDDFAAIFPKFNFTFDSSFVYDLDLNSVSGAIGKEFLEHGEPFDPLPEAKVRERVFLALLYEFYRYTAIGPIVDLEEAWKRRKPELERLRTTMIEEYLILYESVVEVLSDEKMVEEVVEVTAKEDKKKKGSGK